MDKIDLFVMLSCIVYTYCLSRNYRKYNIAVKSACTIVVLDPKSSRSRFQGYRGQQGITGEMGYPGETGDFVSNKRTVCSENIYIYVYTCVCSLNHLGYCNVNRSAPTRGNPHTSI